MNEKIIALREEDQSMLELKNKLSSIEHSIETKQRELKDYKKELWAAQTKEATLTGDPRKAIKAYIKSHTEKIKNLNQVLEAEESTRDNLEKDITALEAQRNRGDRSAKSVANVLAAMEKLNANYIASEGLWYCIYTNGFRHKPVISIISNEKMKDLILNETGWVETNDITIKQIAQQNGRMYRNVERTFLHQRDGVLNQMNELRKFWLKPIYDQKPHIAFDILTSNLVDGDEDYKNQLEKYVAYRYSRPDDIFAPNIDSSGRGGSGRDTFFTILEYIFTEECCGEANSEAFTGTHNGELWGKVWIKISERNAKAIDYNEFKNLTGGHNFRLRRMNENATQAPRTFLFFIMNNGYNGTIQLAGTGKSSEDRRVEPIFSNTSLKNRIADFYDVDPDSDTATDILQEWQDTVYQNEEEIARWLGYIIQKHMPDKINKLLPLHGRHYDQMLERQKNAFNTFMETLINLTSVSNCYSVDDIWKIYKLATFQTNIDKTRFGKNMCKWLIDKSGQDWQMRVKDIYLKEDDDVTERKRRSVVFLPENVVPGSHNSKLIFDIFDFILDDKTDERGNPLGAKPHMNNIMGDFL